MDRQSKIWGERWLIRQDSTHAVSYLKIFGGFRCSLHSHMTKYNLFVVLHGRIGILCQEIGADGIISEREVLLSEGQSFTTRPGQVHEFRAYQNSDVIEEMYVQYDEVDIQRQSMGGQL